MSRFGSTVSWKKNRTQRELWLWRTAINPAPTERHLALTLTPTLFYENPFLVKPVFSHFDIPVALWSDIGAH